MLASLSFALLATAVAGTTPCESLKSLSTPQAVIETAEFVQAGPVRSAWRRRSRRGAAGRGAAPAGRGAAPGAAGGSAFAAAALPRGADAQAVVGFEDRRRALDAGRELERQVHDDGQRRVCRIHPGLRRHAGGPASRLRGRWQRRGTHGRRGSQRHVRARPSGEDRRLLAPRRARDDGDVEAADQGVLRSSGAVLVLQGLLDRRTPGGDGGPALPRRLRRDYRRRPREPAHPHAHGGLRAQHHPRQKSRPGDLARQGADGERRRDEQVRHDEGRLPEQPAPVQLRFLDAALQGRGRGHAA